MNCLDFRRDCQADPNGLSDAHRAHMRDCLACARFASAQMHFDQHLESAMRVEPPQGLAARVVFERSMRGRRRLRWLAAAAVAVLGLGTVTTAMLIVPESASQGMLAEHLQVDPLQGMPADDDAPAELSRIAGELGMPWHADRVGRVLQAKLCDLDGHRGAHFVVETGGTRVTAFVMPGLDAGAAGRLEVAGMPGMLLETPQGVIAVFCPDAARLAEVSERVRRAVSWDAA